MKFKVRSYAPGAEFGFSELCWTEEENIISEERKQQPL